MYVLQALDSEHDYTLALTTSISELTELTYCAILASESAVKEQTEDTNTCGTAQTVTR